MMTNNLVNFGRTLKYLFKNAHCVSSLVSRPSSQWHSQRLTDNLDFMSADVRKNQQNSENFVLHQNKILESSKLVAKTSSNGEKSTLVLLLGWMAASKPNLRKHCDFYLANGIDVLLLQYCTRCYLKCGTCFPKLSDDLLKFLQENPHYDIIIHGFSASSLIWGHSLSKMAENYPKFQNVVARIKGQIWDSPSRHGNAAEGVSTTFYPNNPFLRKAAKVYYRTLYQATHPNVFVKAIITYGNDFRNNGIVKCPALFFGSKNDQMSTFEELMKTVITWRANGIEVKVKSWEKSGHVAHLRHHPDEYIEERNEFWRRLGIIQ